MHSELMRSRSQNFCMFDPAFLELIFLKEEVGSKTFS